MAGGFGRLLSGGAAKRAALAAALAAAAFAASCSRERGSGEDGGEEMWEVTAYCSCGKCCHWEKDASGRTVWSKGPSKGRPKDVGVTACGRPARRGTVAADWSVLPRGTRLWVEGYGECRVEDKGGAIKGRHIDLWFPSHEEAKAWGRKVMPVRIIEKGAAE